jgi:hypothetical protein
MSSTNRGSTRHGADYYVTPIQSIDDFLMEFDNDIGRGDFPEVKLSPLDEGVLILDPCAGGDGTHSMSYPEAIKKYRPEADIRTMDIRKYSRADYKGDYLGVFIEPPPDVIITNPPFDIAQKVIEKALRDVRPGGTVIMLLRLNFFGSQSRKTFFQNHMPVVCYIHSKRMKFLNTASTDSIEYMHAVWVSGVKPKFTKMRII